MSRLRVAPLSTSLLLAAALGACARLDPPAPVYQGTWTPRPASAPAVASTRAPARQALPAAAPTANPMASVVQTTGGEIVVKPGDTLYLVARRHNVPTRALIDANDLRPPYVLQSGQRLTLPQMTTYQVQAGDTLSGIARRFGLGTNEMVRANALPPPYAVQVGQLLVIPGGAALPAPAADPTPVVAERASTAAASPTAVASAPTPAPAAATTSAAPPPLPPATEVASIGSTPAIPPSVVQPPVIQPAAVAPRAAAPAPEPEEEVQPRSGRGFLWPVRGTILSDYGTKPGGLQNDGINIAAPRGAPIRAAEGGTVVYAGNELRGFGNLLLVRHRDGWITAYAHADELLVKRGDSVRRGQVIGRVGQSGAVNSPQLHFEVRKGARHVNPRDHLAAQSAAL